MRQATRTDADRAVQAIQQIWEGFRQEFQQQWSEAVAEGKGGDLALGSLYGPEAPAGAQALQVSSDIALPVTLVKLAAASEQVQSSVPSHQAVAEGKGRELALGSLYGPEAPAGNQALQVWICLQESKDMLASMAWWLAADEQDCSNRQKAREAISHWACTALNVRLALGPFRWAPAEILCHLRTAESAVTACEALDCTAAAVQAMPKSTSGPVALLASIHCCCYEGCGYPKLRCADADSTILRRPCRTPSSGRWSTTRSASQVQ